MCPLCPVQSTRSSCFCTSRMIGFHMPSVLSCFFGSKTRDCRMLYSHPLVSWNVCLMTTTWKITNAFTVGCLTSIWCGWVGLMIAVKTSVKGTYQCWAKQEEARLRFSVCRWSPSGLALCAWRRDRWIRNGRFAHCPCGAHGIFFGRWAALLLGAAMLCRLQLSPPLARPPCAWPWLACRDDRAALDVITASLCCFYELLRVRRGCEQRRGQLGTRRTCMQKVKIIVGCAQPNCE